MAEPRFPRSLGHRLQRERFGPSFFPTVQKFDPRSATRGAPFVSPLFGVYSPGVPHIRAQTAKIKPNVRLSTAEQFADDLGRISDHRHHAALVEPFPTPDPAN